MKGQVNSYDVTGFQSHIFSTLQTKFDRVKERISPKVILGQFLSFHLPKCVSTTNPK